MREERGMIRGQKVDQLLVEDVKFRANTARLGGEAGDLNDSRQCMHTCQPQIEKLRCTASAPASSCQALFIHVYEWIRVMKVFARSLGATPLTLHRTGPHRSPSTATRLNSIQASPSTSEHHIITTTLPPPHLLSQPSPPTPFPSSSQSPPPQSSSPPPSTPPESSSPPASHLPNIPAVPARW